MANLAGGDKEGWYATVLSCCCSRQSDVGRYLSDPEQIVFHLRAQAICTIGGKSTRTVLIDSSFSSLR